MGKLESAAASYNDAVKRMNELGDQIEALTDDASDEDLTKLEDDFQESSEAVNAARSNRERYEQIAEARQNNPVIEVPEVEDEPEGRLVAAKGETRSERTYRPDGDHSFFADIRAATLNADSAAAARLAANQAEARDISTTATAGGGFVPPVYLGDLFADIARPARPFADVFPSHPLPPDGMVISIPRITTGPSVAVQTADNAAVNEVDLVEATLTYNVRTIAGQQDISQQLLDRSNPSIDSIVFGDLRSSYDMQLDLQLLAGSGSSGQIAGMRGVSGVNTVAYTDSTPTAAELLPKLYDAVQKVATNRYAPADTIVMHPRRAAWLASNLSSTFPLFQQGNLTQAVGTQNHATLTSFGGMQVVLDPNIGTTYGAGTNEDEIYILKASDLILWEGPLQSRVLPEVLSGTLTVRVQLFGYAAFASSRYPAAISIISGTGLATPTF